MTTTERDLARGQTPDVPNHADLDVAPGRSNRSGQLRAPEAPEISGILMRKVSGTQSIDPEHAIAAASGSSGMSLPDGLRSKFEGSLGADLSSVRIHTGSESQRASHAVGAHAYALGNDIHFASGQYDPHSERGQHLIAHEVAHTVQQRGGVATRQHKLTVSSPGDRAELEADRAADLMVAGAHATVTSGLSTAIHRASCTPGAPDFDPDQCSPHVGPMSEAEMDRHTDAVNNYKPVNWLERAGVSSVDLGTVPTPRAFHPQMQNFNPDFFPVSTAVTSTLSSLIAPLTEYKQFAAEAEKADAPSTEKLHPNDPNSALNNTRPSGSANKIQDSYAEDGSGIKADKTKINASKLDATGHANVKKLRDALQASTGKITQKGQNVTAKASAVNSAIAAAMAAQGAISKALNDSKIADLDAKKAEWVSEQAAFKSSASIVKGSIGLIAAGVERDPAKTANAAVDLVEAGANAFYTHQVQNIEKEKSKLAVSNAQLGQLAPWAAYSAAQTLIATNIAALTEANNDYESAKVARDQIYADLAIEIDKAMAANGSSKADRDCVQSAVTAVPLMEKVISRLDAIVATCVLPAYSEKNGIAAAACLNLGEFLGLVADIQGYKEAATVDRVTWKNRLTAASDVTKQVR